MSGSLLIIGAGGHAKVLVDTLLREKRSIEGLLDSDPSKKGLRVLGAAVLGDDALLLVRDPTTTVLVNGVGSVGVAVARQLIFDRYKARGFQFASVVHPDAVVAIDAALGEGVQIMAGVVIQPGCRFGCNTIVNTRASVDHDCSIGSHVHIGPGATISGDVRVGDGTHVGTGAIIVQGMRVGSGCLVAAGAVVVHDVPDGSTVMGVPARRRQP